MSDDNKKKKQRSTYPAPVIPPHLPVRICGHTRRVGRVGVLEHAGPVRAQRADISVPDPVGPIVDLERDVPVLVGAAGHPLGQPQEGGAGDAVGDVVAVRAFDVGLHARARGRDEVDEAGVDDAVAAGPDLVVYEVDVGSEGGGVFGQVGLEGRSHDAEEEVGFGAGDAVEVFVFGLAGGRGGAGGDRVFGVEVAGEVRRGGLVSRWTDQ